MFVADFAWVDMPKDDFWAGMYTTCESGVPKEFEIFKFIIDKAPDSPFDIFNIPPYLMFRAGHEAGMQHIEHIPQYPDPAVKDNKVVRRYLDECNPSDYLMKFKVSKP